MDIHQDNKKSRFHRIRVIKLNKVLLNSIFIGALCLLGTLSVFSYLELRTLMDSNRLVSHTHTVLGTLDEALYSLSNMESDQRGYLITRDVTYLHEMDDTKNHLSLSLEKLNELTQDNPEQNKRVSRFISLTRERLELLNKVTHLKHSDILPGADELALFNKSNAMSDKVKSLVQEIKSVELVLLDERNMKVIKNADAGFFFLLMGSLTSIALLFIPFILANFELINRQIIEYKNRRMGAYLRQIIESTSEMIAALDEKNCFRIFNEAYQFEFKQLFKRSLVVGMHLDEAFTNVPDEKKELVNIWKGSMEPDETSQSLDLKNYHFNRILEFSSKQIIDEHKEIKGIVHTVRNITEKVREHKELQVAYDKLTAGMKELKNKNDQITLLVDMSDILLAAGSQEELSDVMAKYARHLLSFCSGYLFIMHPSKNYLEMINQWGSPNKQEGLFSADSCWAIRLGRTYQVKTSSIDLLCEHITERAHSCTMMCVPLMAQNDIYGLMYLEADQVDFQMTEGYKLVITAFAELTALALANVRLRENLRYQSIRDPLTGLYNRRYLEDALFKQKHQAERSKTCFAILMLDLDHFKKINDSYGHDAGDTALKEVSTVLHNEIRTGDVAARYGGEEFVLMLHDISLENAKMRAEHIRVSVSKLQIRYGAQMVGQITLSIGLALYPDDGTEINELMELADKALYQAKKTGRNRIVTAGEVT